MRIADRTKEQLTEELEVLRSHVAELEKMKAEHKEMGNVLGRSVERFPTWLEEAPIGICNTDLKGKITYVNKRFEEVSGYSRQDVVGKNGLKLRLFSAEALKLLTKRLGERLRGRPSRLLEIRFKCKDGHWIWIAMEAKLMREKGIPVGFQIISRDITARKEAEEALQAEKNKLQSVIDAMEDGLSIQDTDYNILYQSKPSRMTGGYHPGEKCYQAYEGKDSLCDGCPVEKAFEDGKSHASDRRIVTLSGEILFLENTASPIKDAEGKIVSCLEITRDITERRQAEAALRESEERFRSIVENSQAGIMILDSAYRLIYVNDELCRISKRSRKEVMGQDFRQFLDEESTQLVADRYIRRQRGEEVPPRYEFNIICKDGQKKRVELSSAVIKDSAGEVRTLAQILDITERKQAEEALRASEEKYRAIFEQAADSFVLIDMETGTFVDFNDKAHENLGYSREEFAKLNVSDIDIIESAEESEERQEKIRTVGMDTFETKHKTKDGDIRDVLVSRKALNINDKIFIMAAWHDITERKRAEAALRESQEKLQKIFESVTDGIIVVDLKGAITEVNQRSAEMHSFNSKAELLGKNALDLVASRDHKKIAKNMRKALKEGLIRGVEYTLLRADGSEFLGELSTNVLKDASGNPVGHATIVRDVTERKQAEEELKLRAQILDSATDSIFVHDVDDNFIYVNEAACRAHGYSREELMKMKLRQIVAPERVSRLDSDKQVILKKGHIVAESTHLRKDGSTMPVEVHSRTIESGGRKLFLTVARDITERKQAEEVFKTLATSAPIGIYIVQDRAFQFASPQFQALLGFNEDKLLGTDSLKLVHPEDREMVREKAIRMLKGEHPSPYEYRYIGQDGQTRWVMETVAPIQYRGKRAVLGNFLDITERKQADEELKLRAQMLDGATDSIFVHDLDDNFIYVNEAACRAHGYSREEFMKMKFSQVIAPEQVNSISTISQQLLEKGKLVFESAHLRKDGSTMPVEIHSRSIESGGRKLFLAVIRDITERKRVEQALRESQEFSSNLLENSPNAIFVVNPDTSIKYVNPAFEKLTGFTLAEIIGRKAPYPWWPEEDRNGIAAAFRDAMVGGGNRDECIMRKKNGERFWVEINSAPIVHEGKLSYFLVSWLDITERKLAEEERTEMEQKAHLASRLASVGEMASGIAHEINNPMTAVIGFSQLLMETDLPDDVKEDISVIHKEAQRAANVARNLLTFARKHSPAKQPTNLNSIVEGVLKLRAYEQTVSNIRVNTRLAHDLPEVMADYSQMQQVFINIILNAEAAMLEASNGGTLTITTQTVNGSVRASFTDSGPGIPKENLNRIFDPFFTTKEVGKGTGLGLSVCHGIIAEHGGKIYARSKVGHGATFIVELPVNAHPSAGRN